MQEQAVTQPYYSMTAGFASGGSACPQRFLRRLAPRVTGRRS